MTKTTKQIGPHSRPHALAKLDGRTREAALMRRTRADLTAYVKNPTVVQTALIERAVWLTLRINLLEVKLAAGIEMSDHASRSYIAFSNALRRVLAELSPQAASKPLTLADHLAARQAEGSAK